MSLISPIIPGLSLLLAHADSAVRGAGARLTTALDSDALRQTLARLATDDSDPIPARLVNEYAYCPRLFHLMYVAKRWDDNPYTAEGRSVRRGRRAPGARDRLCGQSQAARTALPGGPVFLVGDLISAVPLRLTFLTARKRHLNPLSDNRLDGHTFPRLHRRGPIEAYLKLETCAQILRDFA